MANASSVSGVGQAIDLDDNSLTILRKRGKSVAVLAAVGMIHDVPSLPRGQRAVSASSARASHCSSASSSCAWAAARSAPMRARSRWSAVVLECLGQAVSLPGQTLEFLVELTQLEADGGRRPPAGVRRAAAGHRAPRAGRPVAPLAGRGRRPGRSLRCVVAIHAARPPGTSPTRRSEQATSRSVTRSRNVRSWLTVTRAPGHSSKKSSRARRVSRSKSLVGSSTSSTFGRPARTIKQLQAAALTAR